MCVALQVPFRLPPPFSWSRGWLLVYVSLVVLSVYRLEYAYAALVSNSIFMIIYVGTLNLVLLIRPVAQSALVGPATTTYSYSTLTNFKTQALIRLYNLLRWFTWEFYTLIHILWEAVLSHRNKSLLWYHKTSPVVIHCAITAAVWFAQVCWTIITATYEVPEDPPSPPLSPRVLEPLLKPRGIWIGDLKKSDPALFLPNNAPPSPVESTPWSTACSPESLPPPRLEDQIDMSLERKKSKPKLPAAPQSGPMAPWSLTVKGIAGNKPKLVHLAPETLNAPLPMPSTPFPPVEPSFRKGAVLRTQAKVSVRLASRKSLHDRARIRLDSSGTSVPSSPPRKRSCSINAKQIAAAAPADCPEVKRNGPKVGAQNSDEMSVVSSVSAAPARMGPRVNAVPVDAVLPIPKLVSPLSAPIGLPLASVPPQETVIQVPGLIVTCPTPPNQTQSIATINQTLLHTKWSPTVATPNSNGSVLQSGTEATRQAGVSTVGGMLLRYPII